MGKSENVAQQRTGNRAATEPGTLQGRYNSRGGEIISSADSVVQTGPSHKAAQSFSGTGKQRASLLLLNGWEK